MKKTRSDFQFKKILAALSFFFLSIIIAFFILPLLNSTTVEESFEPLLSKTLVETIDHPEEIIPMEYEIKLLDEWLQLIPESLKETEWLIVVEISEQKDYIFQNHKLIQSYSVSTGSATRYSYNATLPIGIWKIGKKYPYSLGEIYGPRLMYLEWWNGTSFEKTLKALHGTNEPENLGQATSLGCIYHSNEDITELYELIPEDTLVITVE